MLQALVTTLFNCATQKKNVSFSEEFGNNNLLNFISSRYYISNFNVWLIASISKWILSESNDLFGRSFRVGLFHTSTLDNQSLVDIWEDNSNCQSPIYLLW
jgi:hypothetical protein